MSTDDGGLSPREHDQLRDLVLAGTQRIRPAGAYRAQFVAAGVALVLVGAVTGGVITATLRTDDPPPPVSTPSPSPTALAGEGWIAFSTYGGEEDIYFVKEGSAPHLVLESDDVSHGQVCPAFSPDGTRLASGDGGYVQQGPKDGALVITDLAVGGGVATSEVIPLDGLRQQPCPIWSPDGRWVAFGVGTADNVHTWAYPVARDVWLFNTETDEVRRLRGLSATDIEWAADSSQLYIAAADGIAVYSIADDQTRTLDDSDGAVALSASPDGGTLAVERRRGGPLSGLTDHFELLLMRVDGMDRRVLVDDYAHNLGIGPVWSPDGTRIVFQGGEGTRGIRGGETFTDGEKDVVVIVTVGDDPLAPVGTQTVLAPIQTTDGGQTRQWLPATVSWSPDSAALRLVGWQLTASSDFASSALLTVPVDGLTPPTILVEGPDVGRAIGVPQNDFQAWSR